MKVLDVFKLDDKLSVTLEGKCEEIRTGSKLIDGNKEEYEVFSVAMVSNESISDFSKTTTVLISDCDISQGSELYITDCMLN